MTCMGGTERLEGWPSEQGQLLHFRANHMARIVRAEGHNWLSFFFRGEEFAVSVRGPDELDSIQREIEANGTFYEADELLLIKQHLRPGARIVDAGSNIGNHAIFFDRVCQAG